MKLTNRQLVASIPALGDLLKLKLPVKTSFRVAKIVRVVDSAIEDYNKTLVKIKEDHAKKDEDGKPEVVEGNQLVFEDFDEFQAAVNELLDIENELEIKKVRVKDLGNVVIEPLVFLAVDWLIEG